MRDPIRAEPTRALLVDDDPNVLRGLLRDTRDLGWQIDTASSAERGLKLATRIAYDVVLTDLHMPGTNGLDLIRRVQTNHATVGFVVLTADHHVEIPPDPVLERVVASVALKPWDSTRLIEALQAALERHRSLKRASLRPTPTRPSHGRILLIEDDPTDAYLARTLLEQLGNYQVVHASRLSEAIGHLHEGSFDHVLTDLSLPDARGLDAVGRIQEAAPGAAVVVLSGVEDQTMALGAVRRGAQDFIQKDRLDGFRLASCLEFALERKRTQLRLEQLAHEDPLTGLFNRRMFLERAQHLTGRARRTERKFAMLYLDLDGFKQINDQYGHDVGDELLRNVARRMALALREGDTLARLGGDEFAVLVEDLESSVEALEVAERLVVTLGRPHHFPMGDVIATPSVGIAVFPDAAEGEIELLGCADAAMYDAKRAGRNRYALYGGVGESLAATTSDFGVALKHEQFLLHFQPQVEIRTKTVVGFEALLRWQKAGRLVPPADFISQLEGSDAMTSVGEWVLNAACAQLATWRRDGRELRACVNVSARQFDDGSILPTVTRALVRHQIPPNALELEITETLLMRNAGATRIALEGLRSLGVRLAVDDFGTGYSSLAYLAQLPVDVLKIDRSFVARSSDNESCATITSVVIGLGRRLGLQVVAEGVETPEQLAFLEREGCELAQGYLLGAPSPRPSLIFPLDLGQAALDAAALRDAELNDA